MWYSNSGSCKNVFTYTIVITISVFVTLRKKITCNKCAIINECVYYRFYKPII